MRVERINGVYKISDERCGHLSLRVKDACVCVWVWVGGWAVDTGGGITALILNIQSVFCICMQLRL